MRATENNYNPEHVHPNYEVQLLDDDGQNEAIGDRSASGRIRYLLAGGFFGIILIKSQVVSWFRIQEMFRFQSFHMYGIMASAIAVGAISIMVIRKFRIKTIDHEPINLRQKVFSKGQIYGGLLFGVGWALTGACPGPVYALIGNGATVFIITWLSAVGGTWVYGLFRQKLPH